MTTKGNKGREIVELVVVLGSEMVQAVEQVIVEQQNSQ